MRITDTSDLWWKTAVIYCLDVETFVDWNDATDPVPSPGGGDMKIIDQPHPAVIAQQTSWDDGHLVTVHNLSGDALIVPLQLEELPAEIVLVDLLQDGTVDVDPRGSCVINIDPYGYRWLRVSEPGTRRLN